MSDEKKPAEVDPVAVPEPKQEPKRVTVTLKQAHTHKGTEHPVGARIEVRQDQIPWLRQQGVIA